MVVQQIHLHDGLLCIHRLQGKSFRLDDRIDVVLLRHGLGKGLDRLGLESAVTEAALELRLLLADLALELLNHEINGTVHILGVLFAAQQDAADNGRSHLYLVMLALH